MFGVDSAVVEQWRVSRPQLIEQINEQLAVLPATMPSGLVVRIGDQIVAGIGVSGPDPEQDADCTRSGAAAFSSALWMRGDAGMAILSIGSYHSAMKNLPAYSVNSVDHALHLATILQLEGPLRVADAADRLGVAPSTAHRLLAMLVYRDFAEQDSSRRYVVGPVMRRSSAGQPVADLRRAALPHMRALSVQVNETVNLMVLDRDYVHFVAGVESTQVLRVGNREGRMLPAHLASGGRAVLARRPEEEVVTLYSSPDTCEVDIDSLRRDLGRIRRQGFAVNNQDTESGLTAIGRAISGRPGAAFAAISISMPTVRYSRHRLVNWAQDLATCVERIERDLRALSGVVDRAPRPSVGSLS